MISLSKFFKSLIFIHRKNYSLSEKIIKGIYYSLIECVKENNPF